MSFRFIASPMRWFVLSAALLLGACGSDGSGNGNERGTGGVGGTAGTNNPDPNDDCALDITLSGDVAFELDFDDQLSCATAYNTLPGARVGYLLAPVRDIATIEFYFPELEPGEPVPSVELPTTIHHADRTQFSPMDCVADVTENSFLETIPEAGDVYRVVGEGCCAMPGTAGDRSISVVGSFRFVAGIRWQE